MPKKGGQINMGSVSAHWQVVNSGGNANNAANDGAFYLNANNASSNLNRNISGHVVFKYEKNKYGTEPHLLVKKKDSLTMCW